MNKVTIVLNMFTSQNRQIFLLISSWFLAALAIAKDVVWLEPAGIEEKQLAIWQAPLGGNPKGALIMIHGIGQHPRWPNSLAPLQQHIAMHGWSSLSVAAPSLTKRNEEKAISLEDLRKQADSHLAAAMSYLHSKGQFNISVLGEGLGNEWTGLFAGQLAGPANGKRKSQQTLRSATESAKISYDIQAVVILNAHQANLALVRLDTDLTSLTPLPPETQRPILDIYVDDFDNAKTLGDARRQRARQLKLLNYRQKRLVVTPPLTSNEQHTLFKFIRGFLDTKASGTVMQ